MQQVCDSLRRKTGPLFISEAECYLRPVFYLPFGSILLKMMKKRKKKLQKVQARESRMRKVVRIREDIKEEGVMGGNLGREKGRGELHRGLL